MTLADELERLAADFAPGYDARPIMLRAVEALRAQRALLLDIRQHQGRVQPFVARIDALLDARPSAAERTDHELR